MKILPQEKQKLQKNIDVMKWHFVIRNAQMKFLFRKVEWRDINQKHQEEAKKDSLLSYQALNLDIQRIFQIRLSGDYP